MSDDAFAESTPDHERESAVDMVKRRVKPFVELTVYYALLGLAVAAFITLVPGGASWLPVGGLERVAASVQGDVLDPVNITFDFGFNSTDAIKLAFGLLASLLLMFPVVWVYLGARRRRDIVQSFAYTTLILPMIITGIVFMVHHSLALAFSLAGIVAGVRFRHTLTDSADATFLFAGIAVGVACGINAIEIAAVISIMFNLTVLALWSMRFGERETNKQVFGNKWMTHKKLKAVKYTADAPAAPDSASPTAAPGSSGP